MTNNNHNPFHMRAHKNVIRAVSLGAILAVIFTACSQEPLAPETPEKPETPTVSFGGGSAPSFQTGSFSGTTTVSFHASASWTVKIEGGTRAGDSWCSVTPMSGGAGTSSISISVDENTGTEDRSCTVDILCNGTAVASIPVVQQGSTETDAERRFLTELYRALGGEQWEDNTGWLSDQPVREWYGVTTDADGYVTGLSLDKNKLQGTLPSGFAFLSHLDSLHCKYNGISGPVPEDLRKTDLWEEAWGEVLYCNKVTLSDFRAMKQRLPDWLRGKRSKDKHTLFLQWDPRRGSQTDEEYGRYRQIIDSLIRKKHDGANIIGWCVGIPKQEYEDSLKSMHIPWSNTIESTYFPLKSPGPAWVIVDQDGIIVDTNLLWDTQDSGSGSGSNEEKQHEKSLQALARILSYFPEATHIRASLDCVKEIECGPGIFGEYALSRFIQHHTNGKEDYIRTEVITDEPWIYISGSTRDVTPASLITINGNPSVNSRVGVIRVRLYYCESVYDRATIYVRQRGVTCKVNTTGNFSSFTLLNGVGFNGVTGIGFPPYPSTEPFEMVSNADAIVTPSRENGFLDVIDADGFSTEGAAPGIRLYRKDDQFQFNLSYPSNRGLDYRGSYLYFVPVIEVIKDWNLGHKTSAAVDDGHGNALYRTVLTIQTPVVAVAEYDAYVAESIAPLNSKYKGYSLSKAYSDLSTRSVLTDHVEVYSNVSWDSWDMSLSDEEWQYNVVGEVHHEGDGRTVTTDGFSLYVNDYIKEKVYDARLGESVYRPEKLYDTRRTQMRVTVDLKDGKSPLLVDLADLYQAGVPVLVFTGIEADDCKEGEYVFQGKTYRFRNEVRLSYELYADTITKDFCAYADLNAYGSDFSSWLSLDMNGNRHVGYFYSDEGDSELTFDARVSMYNGAKVYAANTASVQFEVVTIPYSLPAHARAKAAPALISRSTRRVLRKPDVREITPRVAPAIREGLAHGMSKF